MADGLTLNVGTGGATLATDDAGVSGHVQMTKLAVSADGSATPITADADGLLVNLGTNNDVTVAGVATATKQSDGTQKSQIVDGSGNVIGATSNALDVNIKSGSSSGTQYTEDAAAAANPVGNALIVVREDARAGSLVSADGDNVALRGNNAGELYVKHTDAIPVTDNAGSLTVDNAGTFAVQATTVGTITPGTAATSLGKAEDAGHSSGDVGVMALAVRNDTRGTLAGTDLDYAPPQLNAAGDLRVDIAAMNGVATTMGNGASGTGVQRVTIANDSTGVIATVSTVTTVAALTGGGVAHDGADSGNPLKIGAKAETSPKGITLVADGDRSDLYCDADGILMVKTGTAYGDLISERVTNTDGSSTAFSTFGAVASTRNFVTQITVHNAHATTNGYVDIRDGTAGSVLWTIPLPATGGATIHFNPPLRQPTANTALAFDVSAAITTIYISVNGFQSKA